MMLTAWSSHGLDRASNAWPMSGRRDGVGLGLCSMLGAAQTNYIRHHFYYNVKD
jgi:hypothetical protein